MVSGFISSAAPLSRFCTSTNILSSRHQRCARQPSYNVQSPRRQAPYATAQGPAPAPSQAGVSDEGLGELEKSLMRACYESNVDGISAAVKAGADVNATDVNRRSALHFCAGNGLHTMCRMLVEAGADINLQDIQGFTPLHMATGYEKVTAVKYLLDAGADANIACLNGELPVETAENMLAQVPEKTLFISNPQHVKLKEIVEILDAATELEDEDEEHIEPEDVPASFLSPGEGTTVAVRVRPKAERSSEPLSQPSMPSDVQVTIRVKKKET